jgi:hypothetical protein
MVNPEYVGVSREDLDQGMVRIFEDHVGRYQRLLDTGKYGLRSGFIDPRLKISAVRTLPTVLTYKSPGLKDSITCAETASNLARDLLAEGFSVSRRVINIDYGYDQNFVRAFDPALRRRIQLDASPSVQKAGEIYAEGKPRRILGENEEGKVITMSQVGNLLQEKKAGDTFFYLYVFGGYFTQRMRTGSYSDFPSYMLALNSRETTKVDEGERTYSTALRLDVFDVKKLIQIASSLKPEEWLGNPREALDLLVREDVMGALTLDVGTSLDPRKAQEHTQRNLSTDHTLGYMDKLKRRKAETAPTLDYIADNLDVLANIVFRLTPRLLTEDRHFVDVC